MEMQIPMREGRLPSLLPFFLLGGFIASSNGNRYFLGLESLSCI